MGGDGDFDFDALLCLSGFGEALGDLIASETFLYLISFANAANGETERPCCGFEGLGLLLAVGEDEGLLRVICLAPAADLRFPAPAVLEPTWSLELKFR